MKIFVSYASKDRDLVQGLVEDLELLDHEAWFDQDLSGGHAWWDHIIQTIQEYDVFIFALTPRSLDSHPCKLEYSYAHALGKRILPVLLETVNISLLPSPLAQIQYVDYHLRDRKAALLLNRALNTLPPEAPLPDPLPTPPAVPLSPLAQINEQLDLPVLSLEEQAVLLLKLKDLLHQPDTASDANRFLTRLRNRQDVFATIAQEIEQVLADDRSLPTESRQTVKPPAVIRPFNLNFEGPVNRQGPVGWFNSVGYVSGASPDYEIRVVGRPVEGEGTCVRLRKQEAREDEFGSLMQRCPADYLAGKMIRLQGEIRTANITQWSGMWIRADGDILPDLYFDNMSRRPIRGTTEWATYTLDAQLPEETAWLNYGIVLLGPGTMWADNFVLFVWDDHKWTEI